MPALIRRLKLIDGVDISFRRGNHDVGIGAQAIDDAASLFNAYRDFALGVGAVGNIVD